MKLSEIQSQLLVATQFAARKSLKEVAKHLGIREHVARYAMHGMLANEVIRPAAYIDPFKLGYCKFQLFFSLSISAEQRKKFVSHLENSPYTAWYAELAGEYQFAISLSLKSTHDLNLYLEELEKRFSLVFIDKIFAAVTKYSLFSKKYLVNRNFKPNMISIGLPNDFELDQVDRAILDALAVNGLMSHYDIAKRIKVPRSTVDYRVKKLEESGIIAGYIYFVRALKLGALPYVLLISTKGVRSKIREKLFHFALNHKNIVNFNECIGSWDFQCTAEVFDPFSVSEITQHLYQLFPNEISKIRSYAVLKQLQSPRFMRHWAKTNS